MRSTGSFICLKLLVHLGRKERKAQCSPSCSRARSDIAGQNVPRENFRLVSFDFRFVIYAYNYKQRNLAKIRLSNLQGKSQITIQKSHFKNQSHFTFTIRSSPIREIISPELEIDFRLVSCDL